MHNESISFPYEKHVRINDINVTVKKMGLIKYAQIVKELNTLISAVIRLLRIDLELQEAEVIEEKELTSQEKSARQSQIICDIVSDNVEQIITFLTIAIPELDRQYIENNVGIDDTLRLIEAIIEVNGLNKALSDVKKFISLLIGEQ
jgi:protein associated with RNAse G/E